MNKKTLFLIILGALVILPFTASAQITIQSIVGGAVQTTLYIASGITVIFWVVAGILFLTASGDPSKLGAAKKALFAAIGGTVLVIAAGSALAIIGGIIGA